MIIRDQIYLMTAPHPIGRCEISCPNVCGEEGCNELPELTISALVYDTVKMHVLTGTTDKNVSFLHICLKHYVGSMTQHAERLLDMFLEPDDSDDSETE